MRLVLTKTNKLEQVLLPREIEDPDEPPISLEQLFNNITFIDNDLYGISMELQKIWYLYGPYFD